MSFNVRYDNSGDKQFSWKHRRDFVIKNLFNELPTIIGIQ
jgi:predicted secreted protein